MTDMEDYLPDIQQEKKIDIPTELYKQVTNKRVFRGTHAPIGDGSLLALKLSQQVFEKSIYVFSEPNSRYLAGLKTVIISKNPAATASGLCKFQKDMKVVCFSDAATTKETLPSIIAAAERNDNFIYICNNSEWLPRTNSLPKIVKAHYAATASIGFPDDYIHKLKKADIKTGFRIIDVLAPQPNEWGFEASHTVSIAKLASQSRLWPLYESEDGFAKITKRPDTESVERYLDSHKRTRIFSPEDIAILQKTTERSWKQLSDGILL